MIVVGLHGFFGAPIDWRGPIADVVADGKKIDLVVPDLSVWATRAEITDYETFASALNRSVQLLAEERQTPVAIIGYSMGARLAAHCILESPDLYRGALLLSLNPGLSDSDTEGRLARRELDRTWRERMKRDAWEDTWQKWNDQAVLKPGSRVQSQGVQESVPNRSLEGRREAWARAMEIWSLADQRDLRLELMDWCHEGRGLTLMTGTDDKKFSDLTTEWMQMGKSPVRHRLVLGAGHRIVLEAPEDVASELTSLLRAL